MLSPQEVQSARQQFGITPQPTVNRVAQFKSLLGNGTSAGTSAPAPTNDAEAANAGDPGSGSGMGDAVFGNSDGNWFEGLLKNTVGSNGIGGLVAKPIVAALTAGAEKGDATSKTQLATATQALLKKINSLPANDPHRATLMGIVKENQGAMGISDETMNNLQKVQETQEQNVGTAVNAASTLAMGAGGAASAAEAGADATEQAGKQGSKSILESVAHGAKTGAVVGAAQGAASEMENNAGVGDVAKGGIEGAGVGAATGGALEGAGNLLGKAGSKLLAPFKGSYLPATEKAFEEQGIKAPLGAISQSGAVRNAESLGSKSAFGQKIIDTYTSASDAIDKKTDETIASIKPVKTMSDENLGKSIQQGLKNYDDNFRQTEDKVYSEFGKKYGAAPTAAPTTKAMLGTIMQEQSGDYFKGVDPSLSRMTDKLSGMNTPEAKALLDQGYTKDMIINQGMIKSPDLTFNELKATRSSVGEQLSRDPQNTALKRLYGSLSKDMEGAVTKVSPDGAKALNDLSSKYASGMQKIESNVSQSIQKSNPESLAQNLFKRNSADTINQVKEIIGPDAFGDAQNAFTRDLFENSNTRGKFDVAKLKSGIAGYDKETLDAIYNPEQMAKLNSAIDQLDKLQRLRDSMKGSQKIMGGSQTAYLLRNPSGRLGALAMAIGTGQFHIAIGILADLGGEYAGARALTSDAGRDFLTKGSAAAAKVAPAITGAVERVTPLATRSLTQGKKPENPDNE